MLAEILTGESIALEPETAALVSSLRGAFEQVARETAPRIGLPYPMVLAFLRGVARVESVFDRYAMNPGTGAAGLMQIMPLHFAQLGWTQGTYVGHKRGTGGSGWSDPVQNLRAGVAVLRAFGWKKGGNSVRYVLQHYGGHATFDADAAGYVSDVTRWATFFRFWRG